MRGRVASIVVAGAIVSIGGCGGEDAPITSISTDAAPASEPASSSEADFIAGADSRCAEANAAIANLSTTTEVSALAAGQQLEITQGLLDGLESLGPPEDPSGALDRYFGALEDEIAVLGEQESAASGGDTATAESLAPELDQAQADALAAAGEYGFDECGQEGTTLPESGSSTGSVPGETPVPAAPAPTTTVPVAPTEPAPVPADPVPPTGGADPNPGGTGGGTGGTGGTGSSGGISPG